MRSIRKLKFWSGCLVILGSVTSLNAFSQEWVDREKKSVAVLPRATVNLVHSHLGADPEFWDQLSIEVLYSEDKMAAQFKEVGVRYPGYEIKMLSPHLLGQYEISVPAINLQKELAPLNSPGGPYASDTVYISKVQSKKLREALNVSGTSAVQVQGLVQTSVPKYTPVESISVSNFICDWVRDARPLADSVGRIPSLWKRVEMLGVDQDVLSEFRRSVFFDCLDLKIEKRVQSFESILTARVDRKKNTSPHAANYSIFYEPRQVAFEYDSNLKIMESSHE